VWGLGRASELGLYDRCLDRQPGIRSALLTRLGLQSAHVHCAQERVTFVVVVVVVVEQQRNLETGVRESLALSQCSLHRKEWRRKKPNSFQKRTHIDGQHWLCCDCDAGRAAHTHGRPC
jgi:hypothetical protein